MSIKMEWWNLLLFALAVNCCFAASDSEETKTVKEACTYFGGGRVAEPQNGLVNCSWYASNACCKRTEVTSVFPMFPLYATTLECKQKMNYMMCYFCSPEQYRWYDKKAHVCADFCRMLYADCREASYNGTTLGESYTSGEDFCRGQMFEVIEGTSNCFDFDPTVFGKGFKVTTLTSLTAFCFTIYLFLMQIL